MIGSTYQWLFCRSFPPKSLSTRHIDIPDRQHASQQQEFSWRSGPVEETASLSLDRSLTELRICGLLHVLVACVADITINELACVFERDNNII